MPVTGNPLVSFEGSTYGSLFFAALISTALYGIVCLQIFSYYVQYQDDSMSTKIFIAILWSSSPLEWTSRSALVFPHRVLNSIHEALTVAGAYNYIMGGLKSSSPTTMTGNPELFSLYLLTALVAVPTQGFFVYRLYIFSERNIAVPVIWLVPALAQLVSPIVYIIVGMSVAKASGFHATTFMNSAKIIPTICFAIPAGVDVIIAVFMTLLLMRQRVATNFASTSHLLQHLVVFAVHTGTWTATFALLSVVLLHALPYSLTYTVFAIPICSVYSNTLLANLNARTYLWGEENKARTNLFTNTSFRVANTTTMTSSQHGQTQSSSAVPGQGLAEADEIKGLY